ncbi:unnamed protein product, partial [Candidula unifasciata]
RYVFAPVCRGVAAKRNISPSISSDEVLPSPQYLDELVLKSFLSSVRGQNTGRTQNHLDNLRQSLEQTLSGQNQRQEREIFQEQ